MTNYIYLASKRGDYDIGYYSTEASAFSALEAASSELHGLITRFDLNDETSLPKQRERYDLMNTYVVYGRRLNWRGQYDNGWLDNRDAPTDDPEYQEYLRLKAKFGISE